MISSPSKSSFSLGHQFITIIVSVNPNDTDGYISKSLCQKGLAISVEMAEKTWQMRRYCFKKNV
ncbi:hypothetical protein C5167_028829 [Papaver somniferum]|nr:hypothetical protein C5167_028829 [Papaver somniferum]